jgi:hypothetical protein
LKYTAPRRRFAPKDHFDLKGDLAVLIGLGWDTPMQINYKTIRGIHGAP